MLWRHAMRACILNCITTTIIIKCKKKREKKQTKPNLSTISQELTGGKNVREKKKSFIRSRRKTENNFITWEFVDLYLDKTELNWTETVAWNMYAVNIAVKIKKKKNHRTGYSSCNLNLLLGCFGDIILFLFFCHSFSFVFFFVLLRTRTNIPFWTKTLCDPQAST